MTVPRSRAERLDAAIDAVLGYEPANAALAAAADPDLRPLVAAARILHRGLEAPVMGAPFEARLASRLADAAAGRNRGRVPSGRVLVVGAAVSSAAVGVGVTAYAMWRSSRRHAAAAHRAHG